MAISVNTVWEVQTGGNDTNGGGFVTGASGTDWSQQASPQYSVTDGVTAVSTTITSATANFGTDVVGNLIYVSGGTAPVTAQWRQITARTNATTITVDANLVVSTGVTLHIGGAILSPAVVAANKIAGNNVFVKAGTYAITTASVNVAGGCIQENSGTSQLWEGYQTTRGDLGTAPIIQASGAIATATLMQLGASAGNLIRNFVFDGNSKTAILGFNGGSRRCCLYQVTVKNCTNGGIQSVAGSSSCLNCVATNITGGVQAIQVGNAFGCVAYGNTVIGIAVTQVAAYCLAYNNTGATSDGIQLNGGDGILANCVAYGNGRDGFRYQSSEAMFYVNCIAEGNSGFGFNATSSSLEIMLVNCAGFSNTSGNIGTNLTGKNLNFVTGSSSFFVNIASSNFALNTTSGGGLGARATGFPGIYPDGLTTSYLDIGGAQHQDPAIPLGFLGSLLNRPT